MLDWLEISITRNVILNILNLFYISDFIQSNKLFFNLKSFRKNELSKTALYRNISVPKAFQ